MAQKTETFNQVDNHKKIQAHSSRTERFFTPQRKKSNLDEYFQKWKKKKYQYHHITNK